MFFFFSSTASRSLSTGQVSIDLEVQSVATQGVVKDELQMCGEECG